MKVLFFNAGVSDPLWDLLNTLWEHRFHVAEIDKKKTLRKCFFQSHYIIIYFPAWA